MPVSDSKVGEHHHIDLVYVLRRLSGDLAPQLEEVGGAQWVPVNEVGRGDTPDELPALVAHAVEWAKLR